MKTRIALSCVCVTALVAGCAHFQDQPIDPAQSAQAYDARSLTDPALLAFLRENHVANAEATPVWNVETLTLAALYYQPALSEARAHLESIRAAEKTARQRPNPNLSVTPAYDNQIPDNPTPWSLAPVALDIPIETAGKRRYRMDEARHTSEAEQWNLEGTVWQARSKVRLALLNLYIAGERRRMLEAQSQAQTKVVHLMEGQLDAGNLSRADVTQAHIMLSTTRLAQQDGLNQYSSALSDLSAAVGVPRRALENATFSYEGLAAIPALPDRAALRADALTNRADVRAALAQYAASQSALQLEIANQYPDIHLGPGYQYNSNQLRDSQWELTLSANLPILNQNQGPIAEATAKRREAAAHFLTVQSGAINEIDGALAGYDVALQQMAMAESLTNDLQSRRRSIEAQQRVGETDPLATSTAEVDYYTGSLARLDALQKAQQAYGALEAAVEKQPL